jgi:intraflagellar transport protein 56
MIVGAGKKSPAGARDPPGATVPHAETHEHFILHSIENRDYTAVSTLVEFLRDELGHPYTRELALWHAYSLFHHGEYGRALQIYETLLASDADDSNVQLYIASCHFYSGDYEAARAWATRGASCDFRTRLLFHLAHQQHDEQQLFVAHSQLVASLENQMSLAAMHYMRASFADALDVYNKVLLQHPDFIALHVYVAMCQFKLDQFERSNESVDQYLAVISDSAVGLNLKACVYLRLFDAEIAQSQILQVRKFSSAAYSFVDALVQHNLVVFHDGEDGFSALPALAAALPEARFNLAVLYLRDNNPAEAYRLLQQFQPIDPTEVILRATVWLAYGQLTQEVALIEEASESFGELGEMESIRDTVPGRQCLAIKQFIGADYNQTLRVLQTIEEQVGTTDEFNYNKAMALALLSRWAEAERHFLLVKNANYTKEVFYTSWLCRCYIKNRKAESAWNLYVAATQTEDAKTLLQIIATDCYQAGAYYYAMLAYDVLAKFTGDATHREGMVAAAVGTFRDILSRKEQRDRIGDVLSVLASDTEASKTLETIRNYVETSGEFDRIG